MYFRPDDEDIVYALAQSPDPKHYTFLLERGQFDPS